VGRLLPDVDNHLVKCILHIFTEDVFISQLEDEEDYEDEGIKIENVPKGCSLAKIIDLEKPLRLVPYLSEEQFCGKYVKNCVFPEQREV